MYASVSMYVYIYFIPKISIKLITNVKIFQRLDHNNLNIFKTAETIPNMKQNI